MDNRAPWQTLLREALTLLALPADEQVRANSPGCVACDLVNDFGHARVTASGKAKLSDDQRQALEAIDGVLRAMEQPDFECFNNAVLHRPVWQRLRELAADALRRFGWEKVAVEPFVEAEPGVWCRAPGAARPVGPRQPARLSPPEPPYRNVRGAGKSRAPRWVILGSCLGVFICLLLCGTAVGVWVYLIKQGYIFENTPDHAAPPFTPPPNAVNFGPPVEGVVVNGRLVEAEGGFSYVPPEGWMAYNFPGLKYRLVSGPIKVGDAPNITASDEQFAGSLEDYVKMNLTHMRLIMEEFRVLKQEDFRTTEGLPGVRVVAEVKQLGRNHRQTYYFFGKGDTKYVVVCTTNAEGGEKLDPVFEASMKTFRIDRP